MERQDKEYKKTFSAYRNKIIRNWDTIEALHRENKRLKEEMHSRLSR